MNQDQLDAAYANGDIDYNTYLAGSYDASGDPSSTGAGSPTTSTSTSSSGGTASGTPSWLSGLTSLVTAGTNAYKGITGTATPAAATPAAASTTAATLQKYLPYIALAAGALILWKLLGKK